MPDSRRKESPRRHHTGIYKSIDQWSDDEMVYGQAIVLLIYVPFGGAKNKTSIDIVRIELIIHICNIQFKTMYIPISPL